MNTMDKILEFAPKNLNIQKTLLIAHNKLQNEKTPICSISGGSDSDIIVDIMEKVKDVNQTIRYVFFDTGLEYKATHQHLDYLREKYNILIEEYKAVTAIPISCKKYGLPFLSKKISEMIYRLQKHGFGFTDETFEVSYKKHPKCKAALRWWYNDFENKNDGKPSNFNIEKNYLLKEFIIENPPRFPISPMCCNGAKKNTGHAYDRKNNPTLKVNGIRRAENGARSTAYRGCYSPKTDDKIAEYRALFFWSDEDKAIFKKHYDILYSDCYEVYGLKRTGCAGCPFGSRFEDELDVIREYEPKLFNAVNFIFGKSYEYTRMYRKYKLAETEVTE